MSEITYVFIILNIPKPKHKLLLYLQNSNFSAAIGHRFLGLCLVSVQDLISCPFQTHVVSLQGRPFSEDEGTNGTLSLQVGKHPMQY